MGHSLPDGQPKQSPAVERLVAADHVPFLHGNGAAAPALQEWPGSQAVHAVAPSASWNLPAAHSVHASCLSSLLYVPALQSVAASLPTGQNFPSPQTSQSSLDVIVTPSRLVVPPGHGSAAAAPLAQ